MHCSRNLPPRSVHHVVWPCCCSCTSQNASDTTMCKHYSYAVFHRPAIIYKCSNPLNTGHKRRSSATLPAHTHRCSSSQRSERVAQQEHRDLGMRLTKFFILRPPGPKAPNMVERIHVIVSTEAVHEIFGAAHKMPQARYLRATALAW